MAERPREILGRSMPGYSTPSQHWGWSQERQLPTSLKLLRWRGQPLPCRGMARITLGAIAREAAVSISTVSRALAGRPGLSEGKRREIVAVARALGYRPDPALRALVDMRWDRKGARRAPNLAILCPVQESMRMDLTAALPAIQREAEHLGYGVDLITENRVWDNATLGRILRARGISCVLLRLSMEAATWKHLECLDGCTVVVLGGQPSPPRYHQVRPNYFQAIDLAWHRVRQMGHRRIAYLHTAFENPTEIDRRRLAFWRFTQSTFSAADEYIPDLNLLNVSEDQFRQWLSIWRPDAVLYTIPKTRIRLHRITPETPAFAVQALRPDSAGPGSYWSPDEYGQTAVRFLDSLARAGVRGPSESPQVLLVPARWLANPPPPGAGFAEAGEGGRNL